jgi:hypothetical protein
LADETTVNQLDMSNISMKEEEEMIFDEPLNKNYASPPEVV